MLPILGFLTWLCLLPLAQSKDVDQSLYRRRVWHSIAVLENRLYIDGGLMSNWVGGELADGATSNSSEVNKTISISLLRSWKSADAEMEEIKYGDDVRRYGLGVLWASASGELYRWGGKHPKGNSPTSPPPLWILNTKSDNKGWYDTPVDNEVYAAAIGSAPTTCGGLHLSFGGTVSKETYYKAEKDTAVLGVTEYNETTKNWMGYSNTTIPRPYGTHKMGEAICLEGFTKTPLVLLFGGRNADPTTMKSEQNDITYVTIYDPINHKWYEQKTTGLSQGARDEFCAAGVKSKSGTFEIYAYGGHYDKGGTQKDVCVLTLPGFHWICPDKLKDGEKRLHHACAVAGKSQMISVGGSTSFYNTNSADPWANTIGVLNLNTWNWSQEFNAEGDEYDSPKEIKNWYANESREQITWSSPELEALFVQNSTNGTDSNGSDSTGDSKGGIGIGGIVGAAVGGVAFVALVLAGVWFLCRRRRHQQQAQEIRDEHHAYSECTGTETETSTQYYGSHYSWGPAELISNEYNKVPQGPTPLGELENPTPHYELDGVCRVEAGP